MGFSSVFTTEVNEKEYEVVGTVTISTKEYRDLITEVSSLRVEGLKEHEDWYKEYRRAEELKGQLDKANKKLDELNEFMNDNTDVIKNFRIWKATQMEEEED